MLSAFAVVALIAGIGFAPAAKADTSDLTVSLDGGQLSVLRHHLRSLAHAVSLAHCVDCRDVLVELPVRDGVDAILADDKAELYERLHALPKGGNGLLSDRSKHLVGVGNAFVEKELPGAAAFHRKRL